VEALITGEAVPLLKATGDKIIAGTLNGSSVLRVEVTAVGGATQLSGIERLTIQAAEEKPKQVLMADKVARFFVARLLVVCVGVFIFWWFKDSSRALWITLSVLVVTCPCALALAMPAALSAATANLRQRGFLVARGHVIETLPKITRVIFDKTGTLTKGKFCVSDVKLCKKNNTKTNITPGRVLTIAAALEADSSHPIASAFKIYKTEVIADNARQTVGAGVEGYVDNKIYRLGTPAFATEIIAQSGGVAAFNLPACELPACELPARKLPEWELPGCELQPPDEKSLWLLLCDSHEAIAWISLQDELRPSAQQAVAELQAMDIAVELLSGDQSAAVASIAQQLNIKEYSSGATPADKLTRLNITQLGGDVVLMVGDGINDVPILAGAEVSVAMAAASDLAQTRADTVLLHDQLVLLPQAIRIAGRANSIIKQNLFFSLTYNLIALPLAATGHVAPWAAAIGMTMSSLIVVMNALRLSKLP
jgi:Cu2+-exporting ATPase